MPCVDSTFGHGGLVPVSGLVTGIAVASDGKLITVSRVVRDGRTTLFLSWRIGD